VYIKSDILFLKQFSEEKLCKNCKNGKISLYCQRSGTRKWNDPQWKNHHHHHL